MNERLLFPKRNPNGSDSLGIISPSIMKVFDYLRDLESTATQRVVEHRKGTKL